MVTLDFVVKTISKVNKYCFIFQHFQYSHYLPKMCRNIILSTSFFQHPEMLFNSFYGIPIYFELLSVSFSL